MKKKWTMYVLVYIIFAVLVIVIKGKLSYESLFSKEFCDGIEAVYFYDFNEEVYEITDEDIIEQAGKILYENSYKKLRKKDYVEGVYSFMFICNSEQYSISMSREHFGWQGKQYKVKEPLDDLIDKLLVSAGAR